MARLRKYLTILLLAAAALAALGPQAPCTAAVPPPLLYRVDLTGSTPDSLSVTLEMEGSPGAVELRMEDSYGDGLAVDLASHVYDERAADASGRGLPLRREGNAWIVEHDGKVVFSYRLNLEGYRAGSPYLSSLAAAGRWPYFPFRESDLAYLPGYAVFVRPDLPAQTPADLEVVLPQGWTTSLRHQEGPYKLDTLLHEPLLAGELTFLERNGLSLALPKASSPGEGTLKEFADKVSSALERLQSALADGERNGGPAEGGMTFILLPGGAGAGVTDAPYYPEPFGGCAVLVMPTETDILSDACLEAGLREAAFLYLRRSLNVRPEARWMLAGAAWYLQDLLLYRAGTWGGALFWDRFSRLYQAYREALERNPVSLAQAGVEANGDGDAAAILAYGGAAVCAALDTELQARQPPARDLVSFLGELAALHMGEEGEEGLGNADIRALLETLSGREWSAFFRDYVEGMREIPASSFSSLRIAGEEGPPLPDRGGGEPTSAPEWVLLAVAVFLVLLIPFVLEPYTMRPRKPGFLEKKLREEE